MSSMTKQLVSRLEVLQPQPSLQARKFGFQARSFTTPDDSARTQLEVEVRKILPCAQTKIGCVKSFAVKSAHKCNFR